MYRSFIDFVYFEWRFDGGRKEVDKIQRVHKMKSTWQSMIGV